MYIRQILWAVLFPIFLSLVEDEICQVFLTPALKYFLTSV